jgi:hypothetical protein
MMKIWAVLVVISCCRDTFHFWQGQARLLALIRLLLILTLNHSKYTKSLKIVTPKF